MDGALNSRLESLPTAIHSKGIGYGIWERARSGDGPYIVRRPTIISVWVVAARVVYHLVLQVRGIDVGHGEPQLELRLQVIELCAHSQAACPRLGPAGRAKGIKKLRSVRTVCCLRQHHIDPCIWDWLSFPTAQNDVGHKEYFGDISSALHLVDTFPDCFHFARDGGLINLAVEGGSVRLGHCRCAISNFPQDDPLRLESSNVISIFFLNANVKCVRITTVDIELRVGKVRE